MLLLLTVYNNMMFCSLFWYFMKYHEMKIS